MHTVAASSAAYPEVTPGKFWPGKVAAVLESGTFTPVLPPPTMVPPPSPATHAVQPGPATPGRPTRHAAADPVVRRRRGPRWMLPVVLGIAVVIAAGIAIALAISPSPKPPTFLPGETGSPTATATSH